MMKKIIKTVCSIFLLMFCAAAVAAQTFSWEGVYEFNEDGGRTAGGTPIFVTHQLEIRKTAEGLLATIQSNGYQTSIDLIAAARPEGDRLLIFFDSYGENNTFESYEQGDSLLTLEKKTVKGNTEILTYWDKFRPVVPKNEKSGKVYFQKTAVSDRP